MYKPELYKKYTQIEDERSRINHVENDKLYYPKYHIAPQFGLLNDPNGLSYFNDEYHIFYQYHPNDTEHGLKNWYHLTTKDFINYEPQGIKLFPEEDFENYGIFSGSAYPKGEELYIYYTANHRDPMDNFKRIPYQCLAKMNKKNQIVSKEIIYNKPDNYTEHYRDPIILKDGSMLIGAQDKNQMGCLSLVKAGTEKKIEFKNELNKTYMLECPNYIEFNKENLLIVSTQGLNNEKYLNRYSVVYMRTNLESPITEEPKMLDHGFDFYAPQVFDDGKRKILIPWIGQAETIYPYDKELSWSQVLGIPRELSIKEGKLYQTPIKEYSSLETYVEVQEERFQTSRAYKISGLFNNNSELLIGEDSSIKVSYNNGVLNLDRSNCDILFNEEFGDTRELILEKDQVKLDIYVDNSVMEIFVNEGEYTLSTRFFINHLEEVNSNNIEGLKYYEMNSIKYTKDRTLEIVEK